MLVSQTESRGQTSPPDTYFLAPLRQLENLAAWLERQTPALGIKTPENLIVNIVTELVVDALHWLLSMVKRLGIKRRLNSPSVELA
jgi:hypothetical protein